MEPQKRTTTICTRTRITRLALTHQSPPCTLYITGQSIDNIDIIINTSYTTLTINQNNIKLRIPHTRTFIIHTAQYNAIRRDQADPFNSIKQKRTSQRTGPCLSGTWPHHNQVWPGFGLPYLAQVWHHMGKVRQGMAHVLKCTILPELAQTWPGCGHIWPRSGPDYTS